ncbi:MAG: sulfite exporter TauE/SafE family protein, partial [Phycisphaerae bacterium]|nr:sulfite exporter TauE/SafE family protein [Phycisphaerae bacterium]
LLAMCLPKEQFIGTGAWYFLIVNCLKVPPMASLGLINGPSLTFNLMLTPVIAIGAVAGIFLVKYIPQKRFNQAVQLLAAAAAVRLLF